MAMSRCGSSRTRFHIPRDSPANEIDPIAANRNCNQIINEQYWHVFEAFFILLNEKTMHQVNSFIMMEYIRDQ